LALILPGVLSLSQHVDTLRKEPESYRPKRCPRCGHAILWCHGCYTRKADSTGALNPVPIPRFFCPSPDCRSTCSMLPECIPPRSWYLWQVRQVVFLLLLKGNSLNATVASNGSLAGRQTIQRWWQRFLDCSPLYCFQLRANLPWLGRHADFADFWRRCFDSTPLSTVMRLLNEEGVPVP